MLTPQQITEKAEAKYPYRGNTPIAMLATDIHRSDYIAAYKECQEEMSKEWVSVEKPPEHGEMVLLRHDYGTGIEYSTDLWCDETIKFLALNCISHYQIINPLVPEPPVIKQP